MHRGDIILVEYSRLEHQISCSFRYDRISVLGRTCRAGFRSCSPDKRKSIHATPVQSVNYLRRHVVELQNEKEAEYGHENAVR